MVHLTNLIRFRLTELIADYQFRTGRRLTAIELAEATGISRNTISRMMNARGHSTSTESLDRLCKFFGCQVGDIANYVPDGEDASAEAHGSRPRASREAPPPAHRTIKKATS